MIAAIHSSFADQQSNSTKVTVKKVEPIQVYGFYNFNDFLNVYKARLGIEADFLPIKFKRQSA